MTTASSSPDTTLGYLKFRKSEGGVKDLEHVADKALLKTIWKKRLRNKLRTMRLADFELCHDALENAPFDWELDATTENLVAAIRSGTYRSAGREIIRGAKSVGLTRPLAYLPPRDLLVYITLVQVVENQLRQRSFAWTRFGRAEPSDSDASAAESGWFRQWLRRQGQIWTITTTCDWLVESDIANFFPSLSIDAICEHVLKDGDASPRLVGLLRHLLASFAPMVHYQRSRVGGLPQENFDGSRLLAHTWLHPLDARFQPEGEADRYSRWVDDIVIGADSWPEALQLVHRLQTGLEALDLYTNTAKTRITKKADFARELLKDENDYIGEVEKQLAATAKPRDPAELRARIQQHARQTDRRKAWERVLRRYYTLSRRTGETTLLSWWSRHLEEAPGSAPQIFEYLATFRLTTQRLMRLRHTLERFGGIYENVELLAREYVLTAPNTNDLGVRSAATSWGWEILNAHAVDRPQFAASASLLVAKFGTGADIDRLLAFLLGDLAADSATRQQAAAILFSLDRLDHERLTDLVHDASATTSQHVRFLRAVERCDKAAYQLALSVAQPVDRTEPDRAVIRPRGLMLTPLLKRSDPVRWATITANWDRTLRRNAPRFRDAAAIRWISGVPV